MGDEKQSRLTTLLTSGRIVYVMRSPQAVVGGCLIARLFDIASTNIMTDFTPQLAEAVQRLKDVLRVVGPLIDKPRPTDTPSRRDLFAFHAPVIDERLGPWASDEPLGLKKLIESVQLHLGQLEDVSHSCVDGAYNCRPSVHRFRPKMIHYPTSLARLPSSNSY